MREIKFRAWDKDSESMIEWEWISAMLDGKEIASSKPNKTYLPDRDIPSDRFHVFCRRGNPFAEKAFELMQFTGLKDKNGKEIYEGDIIHYEYCGDSFSRNYGENFVVESKKNVEYLSFDCLCAKYSWQLEIIGNIYENPELLQPTPREG